MLTYVSEMVVWASIGAVYAIWIFGMRPLILERYRSRLFSLRNDLFDYALEGRIEFDSLAYRRLRSLINAHIRYAHRLTVVDLLVSNLSTSKGEGRTVERVHKLIDNAIRKERDGRVRRQLRTFHKRLRYEALIHLIYTTPFLWPVYLMVYLRFVYARHANSRTKGSSRSWAVRSIGLKIPQSWRRRYDTPMVEEDVASGLRQRMHGQAHGHSLAV